MRPDPKLFMWASDDHIYAIQVDVPGWQDGELAEITLLGSSADGADSFPITDVRQLDEIIAMLDLAANHLRGRI